MREIQREILRFCIALLDHPLQDDEYKSAIISGLAVLMIKGEKGWYDAEDFTTKYSAVIKLARLMVVQEAYEQREEQIQEYQSHGLTEKEAGTMATSYYGLVKQFVGQFMTMAHGGRDPTPIQWIYQTRSYGFKIRYTTPAAGKIQWIREEVLYPGTRVQMSQLRSMVHGLIGEARDELFGELMMVGGKFEGSDEGRPVPPIDWENTVDQPSETKVGWSFLDDERNKFTVHKEWWLFERMYHEQTLREQFLDVDGKLKEGAGEAYQRHIVRFLEVLLILIHLCAGQPSRAPEILGLRWKNTDNGGVRNILIENGLVGVVAQYHKGYRSSGNIKIIHRYLPKEVGELLVYYLWLVLPFWEKLQCQMTGEKVCSAFIWGDAEKKEHRQWTGPRRKREVQRGEGRDARREGRREARAKRRRVEKREKRTQSSWTSERVRKIMQEASARWMGRESTLSISAWRQIAIAISRRFCRTDPFEDDQGKLEGEDGWDEDNTAGDDPWDLQAGHGTHIAGMIYARELMEGNDTIISRRERFRRISQQWHRFLEFASTCPADPSHGRTKRKRSSVEDEMDEVQVQRWKKLRTVDIQQALEDMYGAGAQFRGLQKPALEAIMRNESPVLVVMGTSVGKTLLFQIPAMSVGSGTTVVITPLVSLQDHMVQRCRTVGISCVKWESQQVSQMRAQIVIVTPESAVSKAFGSFLNDLEGRRELVRIVHDECHTVMDSSPDFRPQMRQLGTLSTRGVQMVFLTATLPPRMQGEFMRVMKINPREVHVFRAPTTRANIAYSVFEHDPDEDETDAVCRLIQGKLAQYPAPAKIIVYGGTIERTTELSRALDCHEYYREVGDREEKEEIMERWQHGDGRLIVATNAFGLGIDAPDVRVVIHVGAIYQMRNYSQESGRGGRDGQRSEAIVVMAAGKQAALQKKQARARARRQPWKIQSRIMSAQEEKQVEWDKTERFLAGEKCRRIFLDAEMDGRGLGLGYDERGPRVRCEEGEERCDVCEKDDIDAERSEAQRRAYIDEERERQERDERDEGERQDRWMDSGVDVPSSSVPVPDIDITERSSSIGEASSSGLPILPVGRDDGHGCISASAIRSHSPRSSVSFDQGFAADAITEDEREEFAAQQAQRQAQRWRSVVEEQDEGQEVWDLEKRLDSWVGKCPLCHVRQCGGRDVDVRHPLDRCPDALRTAVVTDISRFEQVWFEKFASCTDCGVAQKICTRWQETYEGSRRFKLVPGRGCQYKAIIQPAIAAMMSAGPIEVVEVGLFQAMREEKIWGRGSKWGEWDEAEQAEVWRVMRIWLGKKIIWGSMEASVFLRVFYRLTVGMEEWKRCLELGQAL
jgi:RecQ family ATP-dependent DNA helicase